MIIIANKDIKNNKFMPMLNLIEDTNKLKKEIKKHLINEILESPTSLKAYKNISVHKIGEIDKDFNIKLDENKTMIVSYETILNEIIDMLNKENKK